MCQSIGSAREFRAVYEEHHGFVWYTLHRLGTATEAVEDAVQDVFVVAYRRRATFEGRSPRAWLYGIARRVASNYRRSDLRRRERVRAVRSAQPVRMTEATREAIATLNRYLAGLTPVDREVFVLAEVEGMTGPEVADALGRNLQTIYTRIRKLRLGLRAEISEGTAIKRNRPRASAGSWAALAPLLSESPVLAATGWGAALSSTWLAAGLSAAVATGALVIADRSLPATGPAQSAVADAQHRAPLPTTNAIVSAAATPAVRPSGSIVSPLPAVRGVPSASPPVVRSRGSIAQTKASSGTSALAEETVLLRQTAAAVARGGMQEALQLTDEHAKRFSTSVLADLRSALRIEALCGLGKVAQARGEAAVFLRRHPDSPAAVRIENSCASPPQIASQPDKQGT